MPPPTKRSTAPLTRAAVPRDTAVPSTKMPTNGGNDSASSSAPCPGPTTETIVLRATTPATPPAPGCAGEHPRDLREPAHVREIQRERGRLAHVAAAHQVPRVHDHVVAERDVDAGREQLLQLREAAPFRIDVESALDQRVRVGVD